MKIETYILAHNEERLMPYIIRHYSQFSDVIIMENNSTDNTVEIAFNMGASVVEMETPDVKCNEYLRQVKNNCWKGSKADWVIAVDADEFVYHPNIVKALSKTKATVLKPVWYEMFAENFPTTHGQIYDEIKTGHTQPYLKLGSKATLFKPHEIQEMNYGAGCHDCCPVGNVIFEETDIKTLHYRWLGFDYVLNRNKRDRERLSDYNKKMGWSFQYSYPEEKVKEEFYEGLKKCKKII